MDQPASNFLSGSAAVNRSLRGLSELDSTREPRPMTMIGIAGASGAGKSLLARLLYERLSVGRSAEDIGILNEDSYYRDRSDLTLSEREKINYDHPDALEHDLLIEHLIDLKHGRPVDVPQYNYALHNRSPETVSLVPPKLLILEGILILHVAALAERLDLRVFVDVPMDVCLTRRLRRDIQQRGRQLESVLRQYETSVRPMFYKFIEPSKSQADLIVPRGGENKPALDVLMAHLDGVLAQADEAVPVRA
jgi:uridine kinase